MRGQGGFTLLELMLVVVIIGILSGLVAVSVQGRSTKAKQAAASADVITYRNAIEAYALEHDDKYPKSLRELVGGEIDYVMEVKPDPWKNEYVFEVPAKRGNHKYDIFSRGPDGIAGNEDDISCWSD